MRSPNVTYDSRMNCRRPPSFILPRHGFTMLELVVVVLILGMIAAVASSQIFDTASDARNNSGRQSLGVIRNAIDLFYQKSGEYPGRRGKGNGKGKDKDFKSDLETMLRTPFPSCPVGNTNDEVHIEDKPGQLKAGGHKGWRFSTSNGEFIINHEDYSSW